MAKIFEFTEEQLDEWAKWVESRPPLVRQLAVSHPPNRLYRMRSSGHRVTIYSISEDGTFTVAITGKYNFVTFERAVFGVKPGDLEECDLPGPHEKLGSLDWSIDQVREFMGKDQL